MVKEKKTASQDGSLGAYAIVETSGKQFWLEENRYYDLDRCQAKENEIITLDKVLFIKDENGSQIGAPYIKGATVEVKVMSHRRGNKILVYKMRPKKKTRRKMGHRQELTRVMVESISSSAKSKTAKSSTSKTVKSEKDTDSQKKSKVSKEE